MAKSARRMRHRRSARRHHRGGMADLSPAPLDGMAVGAPAGDAMAMGGPEEMVVLGPNDHMALPDWKKTALAEMGFGAGDSNQLGGRRHRRSRKHRKSRRHSKKGGRRHRRSRRHSKKGGCGCGGSSL